MFIKIVSAPTYWKFELGIENRSTLPTFIILDFQQTDRLDPQANNIFFRAPVVNAHCFIGTEKYPDVGLNCDCMNDIYSQAFLQIVSCFRR